MCAFKFKIDGKGVKHYIKRNNSYDKAAERYNSKDTAGRMETGRKAGFDSKDFANKFTSGIHKGKQTGKNFYDLSDKQRTGVMSFFDSKGKGKSKRGLI